MLPRLEGTEGRDGVTVLPARAAHGVRRPIVSKGGSVRVEVEVEQAVRQTGPAARPWEPLGAIDVERLVVWAFRDQHAHRHAGAGLHAIEAEAEGLVRYGRSTDGCGALADIEHLGCRIDRRQGIARDATHEVADLVAVLVGEIDGGELLRAYGDVGGRPDGWMEPRRWWRPVVWVTVGVEAQWERLGQGGNSPRITRVMPTVTREEMVQRRADYARWWEALDVLAWQLSMRALGFAVLPPSAPCEPWLAVPGTPR